MLGGINASTLILLQYSIPHVCRLLGAGPSMTNYELRKKQTVSKYYCNILVCTRLAYRTWRFLRTGGIWVVLRPLTYQIWPLFVCSVF